MRWPLRSQLVWPLLVVVLAAIAAVSVLNAIWADRAARSQLERQLRGVARTLSEASFPLTGRVLEQTHELSGVHLVLCSDSGERQAASDVRFLELDLPGEVRPADSLALTRVVSVDGESYFNATVKLSRRAAGENTSPVLHLFYPERAWRAARWEAALPPLIVGLVAGIVVAALASAIAARVTKPIARLQQQLAAIAAGDYRTLPLPRRNDELRDLAAAINRLTEMLQQYEAQVRGHERLRTLEQVGGGIAHQMRNAATGCRLALDLHVRECPLAHGHEKNENLAVASRQLWLMERYLQRFLNQGKAETGPCVALLLAEIVAEAAELVRPLAAHLKVQLSVAPIPETLAVFARREGVEQVLMNLLVNGVEAATEVEHRTVEVTVCTADGNLVRLAVSDSGRGPTVAGEKVFEPFFTSKPSGTGLGLAVAKEIVEAHEGRIRWERRDGRTVFLVELPQPASAASASPTTLHEPTPATAHAVACDP